MNNNTPQITVFVHNVFAHKFLVRDMNTIYVNIVDKSILEKSFRYNLECQEIIKHSPNIICLQEVDTDFKQYLLEKLGSTYDLTYFEINTKEKYGNLIMLQKNLFNNIKYIHTSCAMIMNLEIGNFKFVLCNLHLRAGRIVSEQTRVCQTKSLIKKIGGADRVFMCGDFNDRLSPTLLNNIRLILTSFHYDLNCELKFLTKEILKLIVEIANKHSVKYPSVRQILETDGYHIAKPQISFYSYKHQYYDTFDHICTKKIDHRSIIEPTIHPIPSSMYASDHFPLVCSFTF